ncbi:class I SAM-dependent methyltransferase [Agromyces mediolanus]|uniref:methyltransferase n=1 Tax=Agromyces mediolanus TaxID=41986 RepID=UPI00203EC07B|nr:methyltransferase [Agromyces mediolanus]MCM3656375.1 class I SAM-dependent methyltransferase [Agromyces mediolanus]
MPETNEPQPSTRLGGGRAAEFVRRFGAELDADTRGLVAALRADLDAAEFRVARIEGLWERSAVDGRTHPGHALQRGHRTPALLALDHVLAELGAPSGGGPSRGPTEPPNPTRALVALVRLFVLGAPVEPAALELALPTLGLDGARALGLLGDPSSGSVRALVDLRPYSFADAAGDGEWWVASDLGELALVGDAGTGPALAEDHVLGIGGATTTLSGLLLQRPARTALDLGTGSGVQALHAARFSARVVATDVSVRALAFARFAAELNGVAGIEFRLGSLYEPVAGERFDRIVSNPPFVITPRRPEVPSYEYRDGGLVGDALVEGVIRGAAEHLAPGGVAQLLANWEYRITSDPEAGEGIADGLERVAAWLDGTGLEYWIVERERQDPSEYAETWIRDGGTRPGTAEFEQLHAAWLEDFAERGVESVGFGYVLLRRPAGDAAPGLARAERLHGPLGAESGGLGAHLERALAAMDVLAPLDDEALRGIRLEVAPDVTEERHHWPGAEQPTVILLRQGGGFGRVVDAGTALAAFVGAADGELPAGVMSDAIAQLLDADAAELWAELAPTLRELVAGGLLQPVGPAPA